MNALDLGTRPWSLTFSYGRALQQSCLAAWQGTYPPTHFPFILLVK
jgi:fructose-bisphosphate aldolase class 1